MDSLRAAPDLRGAFVRRIDAIWGEWSYVAITLEDDEAVKRN
jgi:hypothetical protein